MLLYLHTSVARELIADAVPNAEECCGFLFGHEEGIERTITKFLRVVNAEKGDRSRRFEIASDDYLHAERIAQQENTKLLGVYHSHPNHPAIPSEEDRKAAQPYFSYLIISVMHNEFSVMRSWRLEPSFTFTEELISMIPSNAHKAFHL